MGDRRDHVLSADDQSLKLASKRLIRAFGGTEAAAAQLAQAEHRSGDHRRMSDCGNPNHARFLPIDEVAELEEMTVGTPGWPLVTRALAARSGHALVKIPEARFEGTAWSERACKLLKEGGDVIGGIGERLMSGGDIDPEEAASLLADADELVEAALEVREALRRRAGGQW